MGKRARGTNSGTGTLDTGVHRSVLPNGMVVVTRERPESGSVAVNVAVRAGSREEDDETAGAAHFMEHMFFQGTPTRKSADEIFRPIVSRGGSINANTGWELINFHALTLAQDFDISLDVLSDMLQHATFPAEALEKERRVVIEELNRRANNPAVRAEELFLKTVFADHPLRHHPAGTPETVGTITREVLLRYRERRFVAANMVVGVCGRVRHEEVVAKVGSAMAELPMGERRVAQPAPPPSARSALVEEAAARAQAQVVVGTATPGVHSGERYSLEIINAVLGGACRRLWNEIRDRRGLAYAVNSSLSLMSDAGAWSASAGTDPGNVSQVIDLIVEQVVRLRDVPVTQEELADARRFIEGRTVLGLESNVAQAARLSGEEALGIAQPLERYLEQVRSVTAEDIMRVARLHLDPHLLVTVVVRP